MGYFIGVFSITSNEEPIKFIRGEREQGTEKQWKDNVSKWA
jgi:hypothetical protein